MMALFVVMDPGGDDTMVMGGPKDNDITGSQGPQVTETLGFEWVLGDEDTIGYYG